MKITIFGYPGTGTSSTGKALAKILNYKFISSGNIFRDMAKERCMSLLDFSKLSEQDSSIDIELDKRVKDFGENEDDFVFESRLAWKFIPSSFKIKFITDDKKRFERIAKRENLSFDEAKKRTIIREMSEQKRYFNYYGIDIKNLDNSIFDLIIDTTNLTIDETNEIILEKIKEKLKFK